MVRAGVLAVVLVSFLAVSFGQASRVHVENIEIAGPENGSRLGPKAINFQGYLTDSLGNAITDSALMMVFFLFDAAEGGTELWAEEQPVNVQDGVFNVQLGQFNPIPDSALLTGGEHWIQVVIPPDQWLWPRTQITSVGHAYTAVYSDLAGYAFDAPSVPDEDWTISGNDMYSNVSGYVGIGTSTPISNLHVKGSDWPTYITIESPEWYVPGIQFNYNGTNEWGIWYHPTDSNLAFFKDGAGDRMVIKNDGNVGIGVTSTLRQMERNRSPKDGASERSGRALSHRLTVANIDSEHTLRLIGPDGTYRYGARINFGDDDYVYIEEDDDDDLYIYASDRTAIMGGNVGIGTTAPEQKLHVNGISKFSIGGGSISMSTPGGWPGMIAYSPAGYRRDVIFYDDRMTILAGTSGSAPPTTSGITVENGGYVGIGVSNPSEMLDVNGTVRCHILKLLGGADIAEPFDVAREEPIEPGMLLSIDPENPGKLRVSDRAYDRCVAGVVSGAGDVEPGLIMGHTGTVADGEHPVALSGRVYCYADASNGSIRPGDLLTTSNVPGHAMRVADCDEAQGAVIGKAMSSLDEGRGLVLVLVSLQ
jgi:hypothetical protein